MSHHGKPWCSNPECPCGKPGRVCHKFEEYEGSPYCARCGWEQQDHEGADQ